MVEGPDVPALRFRLVGLAVSVKSCMVNVAVVVWVRLPLDPVTVTA
jgi:hypothetical protein